MNNLTFINMDMHMLSAHQHLWKKYRQTYIGLHALSCAIGLLFTSILMTVIL